MAAEKFRIVLDYLPCEACLEIPVADQDLHCSLCRRLTRSVGVASQTEVAVMVESPALPLPIDVPPAPVEIPPVEPAPVAEAAAEIAVEQTQTPEPVAEVAPVEEEEVDLAFEATASEEEDIDVAFEATRGEPDPEPLAAEEEAESAPTPPFTFDPESLQPEDGFAPAAEDDAAALDREAEAWAEAAAEPEEVELEPVRPEEAAAAWSQAPPAPEPEPWPAEPVPEPEPAEAWPEQEEQPAELEVLEVVEDEPVAAPAEEPWGEAPPLEPPADAPAESPQEYEVLEVIEDEPAAPAPSAPPAEPAWQDDAWPDEAPPLEPAEAVPVAAAPAEAWPEEPAPIEAAGEEPATPPAAKPVGDPVTLIDGLGPMYAERLLAQGVQTLPELAAQDGGKLAKATGISPKLVKRWVGVAALTAHGVPMTYAEALFEAGYEDVRDLKRGKAEKVAKGVNKVLAGRGEGTDPVDAARIQAWQGT